MQKPLFRQQLYPALGQYLESTLTGLHTVPEARRALLRQTGGYLRQKQQAQQPASLLFICTHNSRRSHLAQIWAAVAARYFGLGRLQTFSGGTEATALHPHAVAALEQAGFRVEKPGGDNPRYQLFFAEEHAPLICFSKKYNHPANPQAAFGAVMVCADAEQNCPFVPGAEKRFALKYEDPKASDGSGKETLVYAERSWQIATEMCWLMREVALSPATRL